MRDWPSNPDELEAEQILIARESPAPWEPPRSAVSCGCFVASRGERLWAAAVVPGSAEVVVRGRTNQPYLPGLLALREGPLLEEAVHSLGSLPGVVLVNASGRDHPRRCGLALHLGARLDLPTIGVTDRPLVASGEDPGAEMGSSAPLMLDDELVGYVLRTRSRTRPVIVHAAWRTSPQTAVEVVMSSLGRSRTPEPIRLARHAARTARARDEGRAP